MLPLWKESMYMISVFGSLVRWDASPITRLIFDKSCWLKIVKLPTKKTLRKETGGFSRGNTRNVTKS